MQREAVDFSRRRECNSWLGLTEASLPNRFKPVSKTIRSRLLSWIDEIAAQALAPEFLSAI